MKNWLDIIDKDRYDCRYHGIAASFREACFNWYKVFDQFGREIVFEIFNNLEKISKDPDLVVSGFYGCNKGYIQEFLDEFPPENPFRRTEVPFFEWINLTREEKFFIFQAAKSCQRVRGITLARMSEKFSLKLPLEEQQDLINRLFLEGGLRVVEPGVFGFDPSIDVSSHLRQEREERGRKEQENFQKRMENASKKFMIEPISYGPISSCPDCGSQPDACFSAENEKCGWYFGRLVVFCPFCDSQAVAREQGYQIKKEKWDKCGKLQIVPAD